MSARILIIEDDPAIADYAAYSLRKEGYRVEQAFDGEEGLEKAAAFQPDLVVLDLMLPRMHGYLVCQRLKGDMGLNGVRILVTSAKAYAADVAGAQAAGADAYLTKPYKAQDLSREVRQLLASAPRAPAKEDETIPPRPFKEVVKEISPKAVAAAASGAKSGITVRFWGTRGSSPAPGPSTVRYGGNTSCTEIRFGDLLVIVDAGTGLRELGISLLEEFGDRPISGHIFVGHTHWDHIQGFPFFMPLYKARNEFQVYSVRGAGKSLEKVFRGQMAADYFPVPLKNLACRLEFVELEAPVELGPVKVTYHFLNHPGIAIGFRFEFAGRSITYLSDHESFTRLSGDTPISRRQDEGIVEFARGSDLLICEAQYDEKEYELKRGWGHSTFDDVVARSLAAEVKHLVLFHHDPEHTDEKMDAYLEYCRRKIREAGSSMACSAAQEKQAINL